MAQPSNFPFEPRRKQLAQISCRVLVFRLAGEETRVKSPIEIQSKIRIEPMTQRFCTSSYGDVAIATWGSRKMTFRQGAMDVKRRYGLCYLPLVYHVPCQDFEDVKKKLREGNENTRLHELVRQRCD